MRRLTWALAAALAAVLLAPAVARADVGSIEDAYRDARPDRRNGDMRVVRVDAAPTSLDVAIGHHRDSITNGYDVWVDTDPADPGPELKIVYILEVSPRVQVFRATDFGQQRARVCTLSSGSYRSGKALVRLRVPMSCLGTPSRLRVNVHSYDDYAGGDFAPAQRVFSRWIARG